MNRITATLERLKSENRKALVTYLVNGDPVPDVTLPAMHAMVEGGADIIEVGVPFSDPMAEGPTIQRAHERALVHGISLKGTMELVAQFRQTNQHTPIVLMGYANPVVRMGYAEFAKQACAAGVDGLLTVDLPPEESADLDKELQAVNIHNIFLIAPTTSSARIAHVTANASGFIYYVSLKGVTGAANIDVESVAEKVDAIRATTGLPVMVGFGIKDGSSAKAASHNADGAVVGSALVSLMAEGDAAVITKRVGECVAEIRQGLDA
ncbi:tryptophan synthase subunit alpha [Marinagarivorans algicola]|uniref:tryptophan synthase subunit alpha n=1 Tax=Marinagarivorans algicola TaxID=1513270 RepID=UPI0006B92DBB|nr:tryptophan synthase subunit alpha [Marinagarivorans algicola]